MKKYKDNNPAFDYEVEAIKVGQDTVGEISLIPGTSVVVEIDPETDERTVGINIPTEMGSTRASEADDDWVIRNSKGELFVMGDQTFQQHYIEVQEPGQSATDLFRKRGGKINGS